MRYNLAILTALACSCVPNTPDRTERYRGPIPACDTRLGAPTHSTEGERTSNLAQPGPFATWNTHPGPGCNDNPIVPLAAERDVQALTGDTATLEFKDLEIYITYPSATDPSFSGNANVADGPFPVIVFAHANNDSVCQIFESYYSLNDHWASWGWIVVSVDGTPFNCDRGNRLNIDLRAQGMQSAIERMRALNADPSSRFFGKVDLSRIVLAGHSRGGGAAFIASRAQPDVVGIITLQGVDPFPFGFGTNQLTSLPVLGITAGNDVDLNYPSIEPIEDRIQGPYSWVNINGGIHAYTADIVPLEFDDRPDITRQNQHRLTQLYTTAFLHHVTGDESFDALLYSLDGVRAAQEISGHGVYQRWLDTTGSRVWIDRFDREDPTTNELGGVPVAQGFERAEEVFTYAPDTDAPPSRWAASRALLLSATKDATYTTPVADAAPAGARAVTFRAKGPDFGIPAPLTVELIYDDGAERVTVGEEHRGPEVIGNRFQQIVVPLDSARVLSSVGLSIIGGTILIDDLRLTFAAEP